MPKGRSFTTHMVNYKALLKLCTDTKTVETNTIIGDFPVRNAVNSQTGEELCIMGLDCNQMEFEVCINKRDSQPIIIAHSCICICIYSFTDKYLFLCSDILTFNIREIMFHVKLFLGIIFVFYCKETSTERGYLFDC